jgi:hypothetical protein
MLSLYGTSKTDMERCVGTVQSGVLGLYRAAGWDCTERRVGTVQSGVLGLYRAVCWDCTERCVGTLQSGVLGPYREGQVRALIRCIRGKLNLKII